MPNRTHHLNADFIVTWFQNPDDTTPHQITLFDLHGAEITAFLATTQAVQDLGVQIPRYVSEVESIRRAPVAA